MSDTERLARIETKLDGFIDIQKDHEKRMRFIEKMAYGLWGAWALVSAWLGLHIAGGK
jgi:hypothetical protein